MEAPPGPKITLLASDGRSLQVDIKAANMSQFIKRALESPGAGGIIKVHKTSFKTLKKTMEYCVHHMEDVVAPKIQMPLVTNDLEMEVSDKWDCCFIGLENTSDIFEIVRAAGYLVIPSLLDLACAKIASLIKGKTPAEIRKTFQLEDDLGEAVEKPRKQGSKKDAVVP